MRAVKFDAGKLTYEAEYEPDIEDFKKKNYIEVKVCKAGICETDLQLIQGYMGFNGVLGHEFVGIAQSGRYAGKRVAGEINCACGRCEYCQAGLGNHCPHRTVLGILNHDGAFADRLWLPEENLHLIPDHVTDEQAVFVEPLAAAFQIPAQIDLSCFKNAIVLGDGRLGNLCAQVLQPIVSKLLVVGKHTEKLSLLDQLGIETKLLHTVESDAMVADLVVDCTGSPSGLQTALKLVKPRGTIVLKSTFAGENGPNLAEVVIHEVNIVGSRCGPFDQAIQSLADGKVSVQPLVTSRFVLEEAVVAFEAAQQKDQLKVLLDIN